MKTLVCLALAALLILSAVGVGGDPIRRASSAGECTPLVLLPSYPYYQPIFTDRQDGETVTVYTGTTFHLRVNKGVVPFEPHVYYSTDGFWLADRHFYEYQGNCEGYVGFAGVTQWDMVALQPGTYKLTVINDPLRQGGDRYPVMSLTVRVEPYG